MTHGVQIMSAYCLRCAGSTDTVHDLVYDREFFVILSQDPGRACSILIIYAVNLYPYRG